MALRINAFQKLFNKELEVKDLPEFWAKEMADWTGIEHDPKDFSIGEDHIFLGLGGYFWAYMTGTFTATALHNELAKTGAAPDRAAPNIASYSAPYSNLLKNRIFTQASKDTPDILLRNVIGTGVAAPSVVDAYLETFCGCQRWHACA